MKFTVEAEREDDGRWLAEILELPGVLAYGATSDEAIAKPRPLLCAPWQIGLNMPKALLSSSAFLLRPHESVVLSQGPARSQRAHPHWLGNQT